jgi:hypothetical protein
MDLTHFAYFVVSVGSIALAGHMARARNRSSRTWLWTAVLIGPLAPLVLIFLGKPDGAGPDNEGTDTRTQTHRADEFRNSGGIEFRKLPEPQVWVVA